MCVHGNEVPFRHGERIGFSYLVSKKYSGECAKVKILRDGKSKEFDIDLVNHKRLVHQGEATVVLHTGRHRVCGHLRTLSSLRGSCAVEYDMVGCGG